MVVIAAAVQRPAGGQGHQVRRLVVRPGAAQAEGGHRGCDQPRIGLRQGLEVQAGGLERLGLQGRDEDVRIGQQRVQRRRALGRSDIGDDAVFVGVVEPEVQAGLRADHALGVGADVAGGRALRAFQLDHLGAHFGQQPAGHLTARIFGQFDDLEARQGMRKPSRAVGEGMRISGHGSERSFRDQLVVFAFGNAQQLLEHIGVVLAEQGA